MKAKASKSIALQPRYEPPTLEDALFAAEGLTDDRDQQIELAAELMALPLDEVRRRAEAFFKAQSNRVTVDSGRGRPGAVVVESKAPRFAVERKPSVPAFSFERKSAGARFIVETKAPRRVITLPR